MRLMLSIYTETFKSVNLCNLLKVWEWMMLTSWKYDNFKELISISYKFYTFLLKIKFFIKDSVYSTFKNKLGKNSYFIP